MLPMLRYPCTLLLPLARQNKASNARSCAKWSATLLHLLVDTVALDHMCVYTDMLSGKQSRFQTFFWPKPATRPQHEGGLK